MTFEEIALAAIKVKCLEKRNQDAGFIELVIAKNEMAAMESVLSAYFGPPMKPAGQQPSHEADALSGPYGGIQPNQIMYCRKDDAGVQLAFLWPWGNGQSVTVKIIREQKN